MLKLTIILACVVVMIWAAQPHHPVRVVSQTDERDNKGNYKYSYVLSDEQVKAERRDGLRGNRWVNRTRGVYSWRAPDGSQWSVLYDADKNGYHPKVIKGPLPKGAVQSIIS